MTHYARGKTVRRFSRFLSVVVVGVLLVFFLAAPSHAYAFFELRDSQGNTIAGSDSSGASIDVNDLQAGIEVVFDWPTVDGNPLYGLETFTNLKDSTGKDMLARVTNEVFDEDGVYYVSLKYSLKALNPGETYTFSFMKRRNDDHTVLEKVGDITIRVGSGDSEEDSGSGTDSGSDDTHESDDSGSDDADASDGGTVGGDAPETKDPTAETEPVVIAPADSGESAEGGRLGNDSGVSGTSGKAGEGSKSESVKAEEPSLDTNDDSRKTKSKKKSNAAEGDDTSADASLAASGSGPGGSSGADDTLKPSGAGQSAAASNGSGTTLAKMGDVYRLGSGKAAGTRAAVPTLTITTTGFPYVFTLLLGALLLAGPCGLFGRFVAFRRKIIASSRMRVGDD